MKQANGLKSLAPHPAVQVIAVASGKGGVGKTSVAVNLAMTMAMSGKRTMLLDVKYGMAGALAALLMLFVMLLNLVSLALLRRMRAGRLALAV